MRVEKSVGMLSEMSWSDVLSVALIILVLLVCLLIGLLFHHLLKSYINSNPVARSIPSNEFIYHLSNVGQILILSSFNGLIVHDILNFKNYLFYCFSVQLSRFLSIICILFLLSISMLECYKKISPPSYLNIPHWTVNCFAGVVVVSAFMVSAYAEVGWCDNWDVCAVEVRCDAPFRQAVYAFVCPLTLLILIGLVLNKTCLKRSLFHFKSVFCINSQVHPVATHANELPTISANVQEAIPTQPPLISMEEPEMVVTPATHLITFIIVSTTITVFNAGCYSIGHCSETYNDFCRLFSAMLPPAIWIWFNQECRKFAVRKVRIL